MIWNVEKNYKITFFSQKFPRNVLFQNLLLSLSKVNCFWNYFKILIIHTNFFCLQIFKIDWEILKFIQCVNKRWQKNVDEHEWLNIVKILLMLLCELTIQLCTAVQKWNGTNDRKWFIGNISLPQLFAHKHHFSHRNFFWTKKLLWLVYFCKNFMINDKKRRSNEISQNCFKLIFLELKQCRKREYCPNIRANIPLSVKPKTSPTIYSNQEEYIARFEKHYSIEL